MKFDKKLIHPSLFQAAERYSHSLSWGASSFSKEEKAIAAKHQALWFKENGLKLGLCFALWFAMLIALTMSKPYLPKPVMVAMLLTLMGGGVAALIAGIAREYKNLSHSELKVLLPILDLTPIQRTYAECLIGMDGLEMSEEEKRSTLQQLNRLLDEEIRLRKIYEERSAYAGVYERIQEERASIISRLERTQDPVAAQALGKSLELCEKRLAAASELSLTDERVDAQLEMIAQAISGVRDSLHRMRGVPSASIADLNLEALTMAVSTAHGHTESLEAAIAEVKMLG